MNKFIYFDVGGVVIKDFSGTNKWQELRRSIGIRPEQDEEFGEFFDKYETEVCLGRDIESLVPLMTEKFGLKLPNGYSFLDDFVNRFETNESILPVLTKAKTKYKLGLLTNMYPRMLDGIKERGLIPNITWDAIIDSSIEYVIKPQKEMFHLAEKKAGFSGTEILFVENSKRHVEAAKEVGWATFLYDSSDMVKASQDLGELI